MEILVGISTVIPFEFISNWFQTWQRLYVLKIWFFASLLYCSALVVYSVLIHVIVFIACWTNVWQLLNIHAQLMNENIIQILRYDLTTILLSGNRTVSRNTDCSDKPTDNSSHTVECLIFLQFVQVRKPRLCLLCNFRIVARTLITACNLSGFIWISFNKVVEGFIRLPHFTSTLPSTLFHP